MRRVWVTVLVGLLGVAVGLTVGFTLGLSRRKVDATWLEAVGTWFGAGVTLVAVILATIAFFSEEFTRRREHRRLQAADQQAERAKQERLQSEANLVFCNVWPSTSRAAIHGSKIIVDQLGVEVHNRSSHVITGLVCQVPLAGIDWSISMGEALGPEEPPARQIIEPMKPFEVREDFRDLRGSTEFTFSLDGVAWSKRYGEAAHRLP